MSSSSSSWSSFGGGGSGPGSGSGTGESSSSSSNNMWIWIGNESYLFKKMAPLLHCGSAGSSSTTTTTTTTQRYYRFNAWYPRMGGTCSLNDIYPVKTKKTKKCASLGNAHQTLSQQPEPKPELEPQAEAEPKPEPVYSHSNGTNNDTDSNNQESGEICIKDLPDMVLIEIFRLLHPVDRIHCISLVCKHWNNLLYSSNIWTYVRLIISPLSSATNIAAKIFLSRISNSVEKLCLSVPEHEEKCSSSSISTILEDILPDRLPKLKLLDIGHFPELTPNVLRKIDSCVPNLQQLNMEHAFSAQCYEVLFSREYLQNIRQLILCGWGLTAHKIETLLHAKPKLEVLSADEASNKTGMHSRNWKGFDEPIRRSPLQRLYVRGLFRPLTLLRELQNFKHLTLLSFTYMGYMGPEDVYPVRSLSSLEHLHMSGNYDDYSRMTSDCLKKVFASPQNNDDFPSKLKFLSIPDWVQLDDSVIQQLTISCPHLRSLCIARCPMVSREGFLTIGSSLRELQLLDISEIISKNEHIQFPMDISCSLVYLHAGPTHKFAAYRNLMFKKPSLILCTSLEQLYVDNDQDDDQDECQNSSYSNINYNYNSNSNSNSNSNKFITTNNRHRIAAIADELARIEGFCCMSPILL